jgi:hypothetical protein
MVKNLVLYDDQCPLCVFQMKVLLIDLYTLLFAALISADGRDIRFTAVTDFHSQYVNRLYLSKWTPGKMFTMRYFIVTHPSITSVLVLLHQMHPLS